MDILVNDQPFRTGGSPGQTLRDLAQEVCRAGNGEERVVVSVHCDGQLVADDRLAELLDSCIGQFGRIELQTQPIRPLVSAMLERAIEVFTEMCDTRIVIANHLAEGDQAGAMRECQHFFQAWKQIQDCLLASAQALHVPLEHQSVNGRLFTDVIEKIREQLVELRDAMQAGDFVLVGDILRYALEQPFDDWLATLQELHAVSAAD